MISARPVAELISVWVFSEAVPPVESVPPGAATFRPPFRCSAGLSMVKVYTLVELGGTDVGPMRLTVGAVPPEWQPLQPSDGAGNKSLVIPVE